MKILELIQGSPEWKAKRAKHPTASEAPVMMAKSKKVKRNELVRMKATGDEQEFSRWIEEVLFERGHEVERLAIPFAEAIIGQELYPITATDDDENLLASFDGATDDDEIIWECKQWNVDKANLVNQKTVPEEDYWQVVQQLVVSRAKKCLYMVTDGTEAGTVYMWVELNPEHEADLFAGWKQFDKDVNNYQHIETKPDPVGASPETLPALRVQLMGTVTDSNLPEFTEHAIAVFKGIKTDLETDQDFANAAKTVKWCKSVEDKLEAVKEHALSQTESIDTLFKAIDDIKEEARKTRLHLNTTVEAEKKRVRADILKYGQDTMAAHIEQINDNFGGKIKIPYNPVDFAAAMKGKKTFASLRGAVDDLIAETKIATNQMAENIQINLETLRNDAVGYEVLFVDSQQLVMKANDDLVNLIKTRISEHKAEIERIATAAAEKVEQERIAKEKEEAEAAAEQKRLDDEKAEEDSKAVTVSQDTSDREREQFEEQVNPETVGVDMASGPDETRNAVINKTPKHRQVVRTKPTDEDLIEVLSLYYQVSEQVIIGWLMMMDMKQGSDKIAV